MSHGAKNCPFFTLMTLPVSAAAIKRSVLPLQSQGLHFHIDARREGRAGANREERHHFQIRGAHVVNKPESLHQKIEWARATLP